MVLATTPHHLNVVAPIHLFYSSTLQSLPTRELVNRKYQGAEGGEATCTLKHYISPSVHRLFGLTVEIEPTWLRARMMSQVRFWPLPIFIFAAVGLI